MEWKLRVTKPIPDSLLFTQARLGGWNRSNIAVTDSGKDRENCGPHSLVDRTSHGPSLAHGVASVNFWNRRGQIC